MDKAGRGPTPMDRAIHGRAVPGHWYLVRPWPCVVATRCKMCAGVWQWDLSARDWRWALGGSYVPWSKELGRESLVFFFLSRCGWGCCSG